MEIELPMVNTQFAEKVTGSGKYRSSAIAEGTCAWREPFALTTIVICDVNSSVRKFHIAFRRGPYRQRPYPPEAREEARWLKAFPMAPVK
jgi:hypothetical protein